jgi:uncharacterized protein (DUF697 family)
MSKKRMPVNVLEEQPPAGGGEPVLDDFVGGGEGERGAHQSMGDDTRRKMEARRLGRAREDVRTWALGSLLVGLVPTWALAFVVLAVVLFLLVRRLGKRYGGDATWELGRPFVAAVIGAALAMHLAAYLAHWLPLLGDYSIAPWKGLGAACAAYLVGRLFIKHYEAGCTLLSLDVERMHEFFRNR